MELGTPEAPVYFYCVVEKENYAQSDINKVIEFRTEFKADILRTEYNVNILLSQRRKAYSYFNHLQEINKEKFGYHVELELISCYGVSTVYLSIAGSYDTVQQEKDLKDERKIIDSLVK